MISIILVHSTSTSLFYSFAIQLQGQIPYSYIDTVIYSGWDHYPTKIAYTYMNDLSTFISDFDVSLVENTVTANILKPVRDVAYEMWRDEKIKMQVLCVDLYNIEEYYISAPLFNGTGNSTWKMNMLVSLLFGFVIAVLFIFLNESYINYKFSDES